MIQEEKAKAYDEAIKIARKELRTCGSTDCDAYRQIIRLFPELKESEDKRIRKELIRYFKGMNFVTQEGAEKVTRWIAWLEKQNNKSINIDIESMVSSYKQRLESQGNGSMKNNPLVNMCLTAFKHGVEEVLQELNLKEFEKPQGESESERIRKAVKAIKEEEKVDNANKVKPKFQNGQWVVWQNKCYKVNYNGCGYELIDQNSLTTSCEYGTIDENAHLWTIEDAKDGDVLYSLDSKQPFIFKHRKKHEQAEVYCGINIYGKFFVENTKDCIITTDKYIPATKEQHDTLMKAMADKGWQFDFEKLELKKIEQSSAWSEEDERIALGIEQLCNCASFLNISPNKIDRVKQWIKSLKERIKIE